MKIAREDLVKQMEGAGFRLAAEHTFLPYQYFLVFTPAGAQGALSPPNVQSRDSVGLSLSVTRPSSFVVRPFLSPVRVRWPSLPLPVFRGL
jgi:hypothetical protein